MISWQVAKGGGVQDSEWSVNMHQINPSVHFNLSEGKINHHAITLQQPTFSSYSLPGLNLIFLPPVFLSRATVINNRCRLAIIYFDITSVIYKLHLVTLTFTRVVKSSAEDLSVKIRKKKVKYPIWNKKKSKKIQEVFFSCPSGCCPTLEPRPGIHWGLPLVSRQRLTGPRQELFVYEAETPTRQKRRRVPVPATKPAPSSSLSSRRWTEEWETGWYFSWTGIQCFFIFTNVVWKHINHSESHALK